VVAAAEQLARTGTPAEDAVALVENYDHADDWEAGPEVTGIDVGQLLEIGLPLLHVRGERLAEQIFDGREVVGGGGRRQPGPAGDGTVRDGA